MSQTESDIKTFTTRVRQLILRFNEVKQENSELYAMVDERDKTIAELKSMLDAQKQEYNSLLMAKMLNLTDDSIETTRKKVNKLLRSVNQCITLLSEKEEQA